MFFVWSEEQHVCPVCNGELNKFGRRERKVILTSGNKITLNIQRHRCKNCGRIHHELPDMLVPYKLHELESIEQILTQGKSKPVTIPVDDSIIRGWRIWFNDRANHFIGCLRAIQSRIQRVEENARFQPPRSSLQRIYELVGSAKNWLARVVRPVANSNNWL